MKLAAARKALAINCSYRNNVSDSGQSVGWHPQVPSSEAE